MKLTTVAVSEDVKAEMDKIGKHKESYNDIIRQLLLTAAVSVEVSEDVKAEMDKIGQYKESYNDIIRRLLLTSAGKEVFKDRRVDDRGRVMLKKEMANKTVDISVTKIV